MPYKTESFFPQGNSGFYRIISAAIVALPEKIAAAIERRRMRGALNRLDDYLLKDMGISRSDIERISSRSHPPRS